MSDDPTIQDTPEIDPVEESSEEPEVSVEETPEEASDNKPEDDTDEDEAETSDPEEIEVETRKQVQEDEDDPDTDLDDEDTDQITRVVRKETKDLRQENKKLQDEIEVNNYLSDNPEMKKYRPAMLKYMQHPAYSNIPAKNIAAIVAGRDLLKVGAQKEREAGQKAAKTKDLGVQTRTVAKGDPNWLEASSEQYEAKLREIRGY